MEIIKSGTSTSELCRCSKCTKIIGVCVELYKTFNFENIVKQVMFNPEEIFVIFFIT